MKSRHISTRNEINNITSYTPGASIESIKKYHNLTNIIKLASNENPLGPSVQPNELKAAVTNCFRYPDRAYHHITEHISTKHRISEEQLLFGNGSDELFQLLALAYLSPSDQVISAKHTFSVYKSVTKLMGAAYVEATMTDYHVTLDHLKKAINKHTKMIFIANPNNPTGTFITYSHIKEFCKSVPSHIIIVLDEAYKEYVQIEEIDTNVELLKNHNNLVITRTFSKIYGLAGLRLGYAMANESIIQTLKKVTGPFNVNNVALEAGYIASAKKTAFVLTSQEINAKGLLDYQEAARQWPVKLLPSQANFVCLILENHQDSELYDYFLSHGIIIRKLSSFGIPNGIRITISNGQDNVRCINLLNDYFNK